VKDLFPGYIQHTDAEVKRMWETGLFVPDTNVLLRRSGQGAGRGRAKPPTCRRRRGSRPAASRSGRGEGESRLPERGGQRGPWRHRGAALVRAGAAMPGHFP
jgi:hypothetical protein